MADGTDKVIANLRAIGKRDVIRLRTGMQLVGVNVVNEMKANRPWTDRTGNARRSLHAEHRETGSRMYVDFGIGVHYGIYLERSNGGKYRIVLPTWLGNRQTFLRTLKRSVER